MHHVGRDSNNQRRVKEGLPHYNSQQVTAVTAVRVQTNAAERPRRHYPPPQQARVQIRNRPTRGRCGGVSIADERSEENMPPPPHGPFSLGARPRFFLGPGQKEMGSNPALSHPQASVRYRQSPSCHKEKNCPLIRPGCAGPPSAQGIVQLTKSKIWSLTHPQRQGFRARRFPFDVCRDFLTVCKAAPNPKRFGAAFVIASPRGRSAPAAAEYSFFQRTPGCR